MSVANHRRAFRPARGGTLIFQPDSVKAGTLGMVLTADGVDRWLLTCLHVLTRPDSSVVPTDRICQPDVAGGTIATLANIKSDVARDCAAVELIMPASPEILGVGALLPAKAPVVGMRVVKSGWATGVSEGVVQHVDGDDVIIELLPGYPPDYLLATGGDSGSIWIEGDTRAPVALHQRESAVGPHAAIATVLQPVLVSLGLQQV